MDKNIDRLKKAINDKYYNELRSEQLIAKIDYLNKRYKYKIYNIIYYIIIYKYNEWYLWTKGFKIEGGGGEKHSARYKVCKDVCIIGDATNLASYAVNQFKYMVHKRSPELIKCIYDCKLEEYNEKKPNKTNN